MNFTVVSGVGVGFQRLHHGGGHANLGIRSIKVDLDLEVDDDENEQHEDKTDTSTTATGHLSLPVEGETRRILESVQPIEPRLFGQSVHVVFLETFSNLLFSH